MKKILLFFSVLLVFLVALPMMVMAQDTVTTIPIPDALKAYFVSLAALVPLVITIMEFGKKWIKMEGLIAQIVTWLISFALCFAAWLLKIGLFADIAAWWMVLLYGFSAGLAANGFFKTEFIQTILNLLSKIGGSKTVPKRN